jgi:tetratricopeptide (TPR) repeat protein
MLILVLFGCSLKTKEAEIEQLYKADKFRNVIKECDKFLKSETSEKVLSFRGNAFLKLGAYDQAYRDFSVLFGIGDTSTNTLEGLGISSSNIGISEFSVNIFERLLNRHLDSSKYYYYLGAVHLALDHEDSGFAYIQAAIDLEPNNCAYLNQMGVILQQRNRYGESIYYFSRIIDSIKTCTSDNIYFNRACGYSAIGHLDKSMSDINKAIEFNPKNPEYYYLRAKVYLYKGGNTDKCCMDLIKAKSLGYMVAIDDTLNIYCKAKFKDFGLNRHL